MSDDTDSIRDLLESATSGETPPAEAPPTPPELLETPPATGETPADSARPRDEYGRFQGIQTADGEKKPAPPTDKSAAAPKRETLTLKDRAATPGAAAEPPKPADGEIPPPVSWKGSAKLNWGRLPAEVRQEITEHHSALEKERSVVAPLAEMIDSNRSLLINESGSVVEGMRQLLNLARVSVANPVALIHYIARQRGIDLARVVAGQPGQPPGTQPGTAQAPTDVHQRIAQLESQLQEQRDSDIYGRITAFASNPAYPFFNDVRQTMGQLMMGGTAKTLEEAYEIATWGNPTIRAQIQAADATKTQGASAQAVQRARAAQSASLTGSPLPGARGVAPNGADQDSIRGALLGALRDQIGTV